MIPLDTIKELIYYALDKGMDRENVSTTITMYSDSVEISYYPCR